jgi:hypothetical protein
MKELVVRADWCLEGTPPDPGVGNHPALADQWWDEEKEVLEEDSQGPPKLRRIGRFPVTAMENLAIMGGVEKMHRDSEMLERLAKVEWQNRRLTLLTSLTLIMLVVTSLVMNVSAPQAQWLDKVTANIAFWKEKAPEPPQAVPAANEPKKILYVGSDTSNKYHYPDCKWAQKIHPKKLVGFTSVGEAEEEGYIPCPACKPPLADAPKTAAAGKG